MKKLVRKEYGIGALEIGEDGVLEFISNKETFDLEDYKMLLDCIEDISEGKLLPYLSDERGKQRYMDNRSKKFINDNFHKYVSACAMVEDSGTMRFMIHSFTNIYRPKTQIRMFKTKEEAKGWLSKFL